MRLGCKALLAAAALARAAAPAFGYGSADATFVAIDYAFRANDTAANTVTIAPGQTVTFSYPQGTESHNVHFPEGTPGCPAQLALPRKQSAPTTTTPAQTAFKLKLASRHNGTRVRGSVDVAQAASRIEVTVKRGKTKAGTWLKKSGAKGAVTFSVALDAKTRKALRAKHRLRLTVAITLTPPGGKKLTTTAWATVSL